MNELDPTVPVVLVRIAGVDVYDPALCSLTEVLRHHVSLLEVVVADQAGLLDGVAEGDDVHLVGGYEGALLTWSGVVTSVEVGRTTRITARGEERRLRSQVVRAWTDVGPEDVARDLLSGAGTVLAVQAVGERRRHHAVAGLEIRDALAEVAREWGLPNHVVLPLPEGWWWGPALESPRATAEQSVALIEEVTLTEYREVNAGNGRLATLVAPELRVGCAPYVQRVGGDQVRVLLTRVVHQFAPEIGTEAEWERAA